MLPEAGATELIFLAAVALIVVGPKDLPILMRKVGQWIAKMRNLAAEFRSSFDELARQSELDELRKEVEALRNQRLHDPLSDVHPTFEEIDSSLSPHGYVPPADPTPLPDIPAPHLQPQPAPSPETVSEAAPPKRPRAPRKKAVAADADVEAAPAPPKPRARRAPAAKGEANG